MSVRSPQPRHGRNRGRARKPVSRARYIFRRIVVLFVLSCLAVSTYFTVDAIGRMKDQQIDFMTAMTDVLRDNNLGVVVAMVENIYYGSINTPKVGGTPTGPAAFDGSTRGISGNGVVGKVLKHPSANYAAFGAATSPLSLPDRLTSPVAYTPGEGVWVPTKIAVNGTTAIYIARVRPDNVHTSMYATVAWFDPHLLAFQQVPGTKLPEGNFSHGSGMVPQRLQPYYMAAFANGFHMRDSQGGAIMHGIVVKPLVAGKATLLTYPDGAIRVIQWGRDSYPAGFTSARQNLDLMVDHGVSQVLSEDQAKWGLVWYGTGSGKNFIWRTGIGVRADGSVVYVQSQALSAGSLANLLVRAGAVTAMALDMNKAWSNADLYGPYGTHGKAFNPDNPNSTRAFSRPSTRDFIAVYAKSPSGVH